MPNAKPETRYYVRVNRRLPSTTILHRQKFSAGFTNGTADYWYSGNKADLWIEYKWADRKQGNIDVGNLLSALQKHWLNSRTNEGRNVAVIVGTPRGSQIFVGGTWERMCPIEEFVLTDAQVAQYITGFCLYDVSESSGKNCNGSKSDV